MYIDVPLHHWQEPACCATCFWLVFSKTRNEHYCSFCPSMPAVDPHNAQCGQYKPKHK